MNKILLIILIFLMLPISLYGEIMVVPLPELNGFYSDSVITRTVHFKLLRIPTEVYDVSIRLFGFADTGLLECEGPYGQMIQGPWHTKYNISMLDQTSGQKWLANFAYEDSSSALDTTRTFWSNTGASWEFLKSGHGELTLEWYPLGIILLCWVIREPDVAIYNAYLIIDGEFRVPTENTTWGVIKSIYHLKE